MQVLPQTSLHELVQTVSVQKQNAPLFLLLEQNVKGEPEVLIDFYMHAVLSQ